MLITLQLENINYKHQHRFLFFINLCQNIVVQNLVTHKAFDLNITNYNTEQNLL